METILLSAIDRLSNDELCAELKRQARSEQRLTASLIAHLAGFQERRLYLGEGYSSAFTFCTEVLGFSEDAAYNRTMVAKLVRKFPVILELLSGGELNLTAIRLLGPYLTSENHRELLAAARGLRKMQVLELIARVAPRAPVSSSVRRLPTRGSSNTTSPSTASAAAADASSTGATSAGSLPIFSSASGDSETACASGDGGAAGTGGDAGSAGTGADDEAASSGGDFGAADASTASRPEEAAENRSTTSKSSGPKRPAITPLAPERYKFEFTGRPGSYEKLCQLQELLRHQIPGGDPAEIIDRALDLLLRETKKKQLGITDRPRASRGVSSGSREIPAAVKRTVWQRDKGRCAFIAANGRRCGAKGLLQFHHVDPHGAGGPPTVANVELRCRPHNLYGAEQYFGPMKPPGRSGSMLRETQAPYDVFETCEWERSSASFPRPADMAGKPAVPERVES